MRIHDTLGKLIGIIHQSWQFLRTGDTEADTLSLTRYSVADDWFSADVA